MPVLPPVLGRFGWNKKVLKKNNEDILGKALQAGPSTILTYRDILDVADVTEPCEGSSSHTPSLA